MFEAFYSLSVKNRKDGTFINECLKHRDIEIVKFESGPCCSHLLRGTIYILKPVCSVPSFGVSKTLRSVITVFSDEASQFKDFIILINAKGRDNNRLMVFYYDLRSLMKIYVVQPIYCPA